MRKATSILLLILLLACSNKKNNYDASGTFEADEVIVSAQQTGQLLSFTVNEGDNLSKDEAVGLIDSTNLVLQKQQVQATLQSLSQKTADVQPQIKLLRNQLAVQQSQLDHAINERNRFQRLVEAQAATQKQLDDLNAQVDQLQKQMLVTQQQIAVQQSNTGTQNRSILSESNPLKKQVALIDEQLSKATITNPVAGTVIAKYAQQGELTASGKALYKIADLRVLNLRAYISGEDLPNVQLQQQVKVLVDDGKDSYKTYDGVITWIAGKAEFTPKTIQTKDERANLVYAVKIKVKNDGYLKIGMYGEVQLTPAANKETK